MRRFSKTERLVECVARTRFAAPSSVERAGHCPQECVTNKADQLNRANSVQYNQSRIGVMLSHVANIEYAQGRREVEALEGVPFVGRRVNSTRAGT
jgi:hypothetical protein